MERWYGTGPRPAAWPGAVVAVGVFDGVHRGHQVIVGTAVRSARERGLPAVLLTFEPHPVEVLRPGVHPALLTGIAHKAELVESLGIDVLCVLAFTPALSRMTAESFTREVLVEQLGAQEVVVGASFRFGANAKGTAETLSEVGAVAGFDTTAVPLVLDRSERFSSTAIRALVAAGDMEDAAAALGRDHRVAGTVVRGDARGRELGYPTANLQALPHSAVPADGVYAGRYVRGRGPVFPAAVSVGTNPTFAGVERRVEAYVLGFDGDLYGEQAGIEFNRRLRGQVYFGDIPALQEQMARDVAAVEQMRDLLVP